MQERKLIICMTVEVKYFKQVRHTDGKIHFMPTNSIRYKLSLFTWITFKKNLDEFKVIINTYYIYMLSYLTEMFVLMLIFIY